MLRNYFYFILAVVAKQWMSSVSDQYCEVWFQISDSSISKIWPVFTHCSEISTFEGFTAYGLWPSWFRSETTPPLTVFRYKIVECTKTSMKTSFLLNSSQASYPVYMNFIICTKGRIVKHWSLTEDCASLSFYRYSLQK